MTSLRPWLAGLMSLTFPGLGHLYVRRPGRAAAANLGVWFVTLGLLEIGFRAAQPLNVLVLSAGIAAMWTWLFRDAAACARRAGGASARRWYNRWFVYLLLIALVGVERQVFGDVIRAHVAQAFRIPSQAMEPTLLVGDHVLVDKRTYVVATPRRGDIVVVDPEARGRFLLRRVVGLPGETVEIRAGRVLVDGVPLAEPYASGIDRPAAVTAPPADGAAAAPLRVPVNGYFVMGDNRDGSRDSRAWGAVADSEIFGQARVVYFSWDSEGWRIRWSRLGTVLR
jgi:signal peptidase I